MFRDKFLETAGIEIGEIAWQASMRTPGGSEARNEPPASVFLQRGEPVEHDRLF